VARQLWSVEVDGRTHPIQLDHSFWSGDTVLRIDDVVALHDSPGFAGFADHWFEPTEHLMRLGGHELRLLITPNLSYSFDLMVDGRSAASGERVPPQPQPPRDPVYGLGKLGASIGMVAMPWFLVLTFVFGRFAPEWGPRWFAANDLALASGLVPFMAGFGIYFVNRARVRSSLATRVFWAAAGLVTLWVAAIGVVDLPLEVADVIGQPDTLNVTVVEVTASSSKDAPTIRTADGSTYQWVWAFGQYAYPKVSPGRYEIVLTPARHRLVAIRPATTSP
jgi:FAIM1 (Fas apoptotic inhibitory molecule) protein